MLNYRVMYFIFIFTVFIPTQTIFAEGIEHGTAFGYEFTVTEQNATKTWYLLFEKQLIEIVETEENKSDLHAYQTIILTTEKQITSMLAQTFVIAFAIVALVLIFILKPNYLKHPFTFIIGFIGMLILYSLFINLETLRINSDNIRYYHLLLTGTQAT